MKQLSGAGLKVALLGRGHLLYVNVAARRWRTACASRATTCSSTDIRRGAGVSSAPVLVDVSLMHKGGLAAGAAAAHAESVMRGLQDYVGQVTARIREANK